jgi:hypothetical protein
MKIFSVVVMIAAVAALLHPNGVSAAKKFVPRTGGTVATKSTGGGGGGSIPSVVKYRGDKKGIYLSFSSFSGIESVAYSFTYATNGNQQGAGGTIRPDNNPTAQRELLFGTCSTSVCTYHGNLTNARLTLTARYSNGRTSSKAYRIKTYF